jgi:hypothetical protein
MRAIGAIVLVAGIWPLWRAFAGHDVLDAAGIVMVVTGLALLGGRGWLRAIGIGRGAFAGLCLTNGVALVVWGVVMLLAYREVVTARVNLPVHSLTNPLLFLGSGLLLVVAGGVRARRLFEDPPE